MKITLFDLKTQYSFIKEEIDQAVLGEIAKTVKGFLPDNAEAEISGQSRMV